MARKTPVDRSNEFEAAIRRALVGHHIEPIPQNPGYSLLQLKIDGRFTVTIYEMDFYVGTQLMDLEGVVDVVEGRPARNAEVQFDNARIAVLPAKHPRLQELSQQPRVTIKPYHPPLDSVHPNLTHFDGPHAMVRPSGIIYLQAVFPNLLEAVRYMNKTFKKKPQATPVFLPSYDEMPPRSWSSQGFDPLVPRAQRGTN